MNLEVRLCLRMHEHVVLRGSFYHEVLSVNVYCVAKQWLFHHPRSEGQRTTKQFNSVPYVKWEHTASSKIVTRYAPLPTQISISARGCSATLCTGLATVLDSHETLVRCAYRQSCVLTPLSRGLDARHRRVGGCTLFMIIHCPSNRP